TLLSSLAGLMLVVRSISRVAFRKNPRSLLFSVLLAISTPLSGVFLSSGVCKERFVTDGSLKNCLWILSLRTTALLNWDSLMLASFISLTMADLSRGAPVLANISCLKDEGKLLSGCLLSFFNRSFSLCSLSLT